MYIYVLKKSKSKYPLNSLFLCYASQNTYSLLYPVSSSEIIFTRPELQETISSSLPCIHFSQGLLDQSCQDLDCFCRLVHLCNTSSMSNQELFGHSVYTSPNILLKSRHSHFMWHIKKSIITSLLYSDTLKTWKLIPDKWKSVPLCYRNKI